MDVLILDTESCEACIIEVKVSDDADENSVEDKALEAFAQMVKRQYHSTVPA